MESEKAVLSARSEAFLEKALIHEEWETEFLNRDLDPFYDAAFAKIIDRLGAKPGDEILDAGCGYCYHASRFATAGLTVTGIDFSPVALAQARELLAAKGLAGAVELHQGDLTRLPFEDKSFQFVNCWGVLMHVPELEAALTELARVLKPGGRLAIGENNMHSLHIAVWERLVRGAKLGLRRTTPRRTLTERGIELWHDEGLMIRRMDIAWATAFLARQGLRLVERFPGQFTEAYVSIPTRSLKKLVYRFNHFWFQRELPAGMALGNILIFEKVAPS